MRIVSELPFTMGCPAHVDIFTVSSTSSSSSSYPALLFRSQSPGSQPSHRSISWRCGLPGFQMRLPGDGLVEPFRVPCAQLAIGLGAPVVEWNPALETSAMSTVLAQLRMLLLSNVSTMLAPTEEAVPRRRRKHRCIRWMEESFPYLLKTWVVVPAQTTASHGISHRGQSEMDALASTAHHLPIAICGLRLAIPGVVSCVYTV